MRSALAAAAVALVVTAPVKAEESTDFRMGMRSLHRSGAILAFQLWQCNIAASKRLGARAVLDRVGLKIDEEAHEAMAACAAEADALARGAPAREVAVIKAAIVRANVKTIKSARNPPTIACAGDVPAAMCWLPWRR
jgi:hypothetical protein